jgi:hypothetical protein
MGSLHLEGVVMSVFFQIVRSFKPQIALLAGALTVTLTACPPKTIPCTLLESFSAHSVARSWNELALQAIRQDAPRPTVHARNLYHLSAAMYDAWASYDATARGVYSREKHLTNATDTARETSVAFAAFRVLNKRYGAGIHCYNSELQREGLDLTDSSTVGDSPAALGNRIGQLVLDSTLNDGSNETNFYADTTQFLPMNQPLQPQFAGITMQHPSLWQPLLLEKPFSQNGLPQDGGAQQFVGAGWREVTPFAIKRSGRTYFEPSIVPTQSSLEMRDVWLVDAIAKQSQLDINDPSTIDTSPANLGNNTLGRNDGAGYGINPVSNLPYAPQTVKRSDFGRVLAEYWADGPNSETPPGHWNVIANGVTDNPNFEPKLGGTGVALGALEWDVKLYLALNGALHDAAIAAWEIKRDTATARPISLVRYMASLDPRGLPTIPGLIEMREGTLKIRSWHAGAGVAWADARTWMPYQPDTFVSPAFPGFISGHSTFSRAAAEVLNDLTGSKFFPGGLSEQVAKANSLKIDSFGNGVVRLQWATYFDAADQAGQSRIWGGIHIEPDDLEGRKIGHEVGLAGVVLARKYFAGTAP